MANITRDEARSRIVDIVGDSVYQALELKETLEDERRALEAQDINALDTIMAGKGACTERLQVLDRQRIDLCTAWGFAEGPFQMTELMEWCDEDQLISSRWEQLMELAAEGSALNLTNGAIIRLRQQQFESSLSILRGVAPGSETYGRNGEEGSDFSSRALAEA